MNWDTFKMDLIIFGAMFAAGAVEPLAQIIEKICGC
jgi:hypothetical protein